MVSFFLGSRCKSLMYKSHVQTHMHTFALSLSCSIPAQNHSNIIHCIKSSILLLIFIPYNNFNENRIKFLNLLLMKLEQYLKDVTSNVHERLDQVNP